MKTKPAIVLDNSVLSAYLNSGWLSQVQSWDDTFQLVTSDRIWCGEFEPFHNVDSREFSWLSIEKAPLDQVATNSIGALSVEDWSCIALAENYTDDSVVVTNDRKLRQVADDRGLAGEWGARFAIRTMKRCAISEQAFQQGIGPFEDDTGIGKAVVEDLKQAEKPR